MNTLKIIRKVERALCPDLNGMQRTSFDTVKLPDGIQWEKIAVRPYPTLSIAEKVDDKVLMRTATIKFYTCQELGLRKNYVYRLTLIGGRQLLVGSNKRPFPILTTVESMPEKPTDNSWTEASITYTTPLSIPQIG